MANTGKLVYNVEIAAPTTGTYDIFTINDISDAVQDNTVFIVDITSWVTTTSTSFSELSNFNRKQLLLKKVSDTFTIINTDVLYDVKLTSGGAAITWNEAIVGASTNEIKLSATITVAASSTLYRSVKTTIFQ